VTTGVDLLAARPELAEHRATMLDGIWRDSGVPPRLLELARLRVAALLRDEAGSAARTPIAVAAGLDEGLVDALPAWPTDPRFTPTERVALAVAEQFVMDCHGITDAQVEGLRDALGDQPTVGFLIALALFDGFSRAACVLRGF
jgi:alkylhydroperoxidase family enzyme